MAADADGSVRVRTLCEHMEALSRFKGENVHGTVSVRRAVLGENSQ